MQTLHPKHFDQGNILAQTPYPGFEHGCSTVPELLALMSSKGAAMLIQTISNRFYLQGAMSPNPTPVHPPTTLARAAPKITSHDKFIDWSTWTADVIIRRHVAIGPLWSFVKNEQIKKRLIWTTGFTVSDGVTTSADLPIGRLVVFGNKDCADEQAAYVRTCDNRVLRVARIKIEGGVENSPLRAARKADMIGHSIPQKFSSTEILLSTESQAGNSTRIP